MSMIRNLCISAVAVLSTSLAMSQTVDSLLIVHFEDGLLNAQRGSQVLFPSSQDGWRSPVAEPTLMALDAGWVVDAQQQGALSPSLVQWLDAIKAVRVRPLAPNLGQTEGSYVRTDWHNYAQIEIPLGTDLSQVQILGKSLGVVQSLSADCRVRACSSIPNDPEYQTSQGGLQWYMDRLHIEEAWLITKGTGTVIGFLDEGVCTTPTGPGAPEVSGILAPTSDMDWGYESTGLLLSHGTATASVACANTDNLQGLASVSWGARVLSQRMQLVSDVAQAVTDIIVYNTSHDPDVRVINVSLESQHDPQSVWLNTIRDAASSNILMVAGAGNGDGAQIPYSWFPHSYEEPNLVAVGGTGHNDRRVFNYGLWLDLSAPAVDICVVVVLDNNGQQQSSVFCNISGTSFSAPMVSGTAALMFRANPALSATQARDILNSTAREVGNYQYTDHFNIEMGHGLLDASAAVHAAIALNDIVAPTISWFEPNDGAVFPHGTVAIRVAAQDDRAVDQEGRGIQEIRVFVDNLAPLTVASLPVLSGTWTPGPIYAGLHTVRAEVRDYAGNLTTQTHTFTMTTNNAPILLVDPGELTMYVHEMSSATGMISIRNGGDQTLNWNVDENWTEITGSPASGSTTTETDNV